MDVLNSTLESTLERATGGSILVQTEISNGFVNRLLSGINAWSVVLMILAALVLYDQGVQQTCGISIDLALADILFQ